MRDDARQRMRIWPKGDGFEADLELDFDDAGNAFWERWQFRIETENGVWKWSVQRVSRWGDTQGWSKPGLGLESLADCVKDIYRYAAEMEQQPQENDE